MYIHAYTIYSYAVTDCKLTGSHRPAGLHWQSTGVDVWLSSEWQEHYTVLWLPIPDAGQVLCQQINGMHIHIQVWVETHSQQKKWPWGRV